MVKPEVFSRSTGQRWLSCSGPLLAVVEVSLVPGHNLCFRPHCGGRAWVVEEDGLSVSIAACISKQQTSRGLKHACLPVHFRTVCAKAKFLQPALPDPRISVCSSPFPFPLLCSFDRACYPFHSFVSFIRSPVTSHAPCCGQTVCSEGDRTPA